MNFYICKHCGNIIVKLHDAGVPVMCCGEKMQLLEAGAVDAAQEKHVPAVSREGTRIEVKVGSVEHPMLDAHYIEFIAVETDNGYSMQYLRPGDAPAADFTLSDGDDLKAVYAYCNLHGLWKV